jgi:hypothetical protein
MMMRMMRMVRWGRLDKKSLSLLTQATRSYTPHRRTPTHRLRVASRARTMRPVHASCAPLPGPMLTLAGWLADSLRGAA